MAPRKAKQAVTPVTNDVEDIINTNESEPGSQSESEHSGSDNSGSEQEDVDVSESESETDAVAESDNETVHPSTVLAAARNASNTNNQFQQLLDSLRDTLLDKISDMLTDQRKLIIDDLQTKQLVKPARKKPTGDSRHGQTDRLLMAVTPVPPQELSEKQQAEMDTLLWLIFKNKLFYQIEINDDIRAYETKLKEDVTSMNCVPIEFLVLYLRFGCQRSETDNRTLDSNVFPIETLFQTLVNAGGRPVYSVQLRHKLADIMVRDFQAKQKGDKLVQAILPEGAHYTNSVSKLFVMFTDEQWTKYKERTIKRFLEYEQIPKHDPQFHWLDNVVPIDDKINWRLTCWEAKRDNGRNRNKQQAIEPVVTDTKIVIPEKVTKKRSRPAPKPKPETQSQSPIVATAASSPKKRKHNSDKKSSHKHHKSSE